MDRTNGQLDRAIIAYRENPTEENRKAALAWGEAHVRAFFAEETGTFIERTMERKREE